MPDKEELEALQECYEACKEFVERCEKGEIRSRRTYTRMKAAIEPLIDKGK